MTFRNPATPSPLPANGELSGVCRSKSPDNSPLGSREVGSAAAAIGRQIADLQTVLLTLAKDKTDQLDLASCPTAMPHIRNGIRIKAS